jgi:hypothetical protein
MSPPSNSNEQQAFQITVRARASSPKSMQPSAQVQAIDQKHESPQHESHGEANKRPSLNDAQHKQACEVRLTCCHKVMKCGGLTLAAALVVTTGIIAYYIYKLDDTCSQLVAPIESIDASIKNGTTLIKNGIELAQGAISLVNQTFGFLRDAEPQILSFCNAANNTCLNAQTVCQQAENRCNSISFGT